MGKLIKKYWYIIVIAILVIKLIGNDSSNDSTTRSTSYSTPQPTKYVETYPTVPEPSSGTIIFGSTSNAYGSSALTIRNSSNACYVKLKDQYKNDVMGFYVRAGETVKVSVPCQNLYAYFASGDVWHGTTYCFGDDTYYSKDDDLLDFYSYEYEYTLYPVTNGNFDETPISEYEF